MTGYLFVSAAIAGACGGLLAYGIGHMEGVAGQSGWRWIMIIEGLPCIFLAVFTWFWLADEPETAYYLKPHERELMIKRREREYGLRTSAHEFHKKDVKEGSSISTGTLTALNNTVARISNLASVTDCVHILETVPTSRSKSRKKERHGV